MATRLPDPLDRSWLYLHPKLYLAGNHPTICRWCGAALNAVTGTVDGHPFCAVWVCSGCDVPGGVTVEGGPYR